MGVTAMGIDIDLKTLNKPNGVKSIKAAIKLVKGHGWDPTLIISTGNGIHCWWIFKEPLMFTREKDREKQKLRCKRLQETIRRRAKKKGWDIDNTFETNRVLRIPGTLNCKDLSNPLKVELIEDTGIEYGDPENDFEDFIVSEKEVQLKKSSVGIVYVSKNLKLDPNAEPPADLYQELCEIDPKFETTFKGQLTKQQTKKWENNSASNYAQSLANMAAGAGWTDQEIANLIIAFYRNNLNNANISGTPDINKALRSDYIERTIAKAKESIQGHSGSQSNGKIRIDVKNRDLPLMTEKIFSAFNQTNDPPRLFNLGNKIVRLNLEPGAPPFIEILNKYDIRLEVSYRAHCYSIVKSTGNKAE